MSSVWDCKIRCLHRHIGYVTYGPLAPGVRRRGQITRISAAHHAPRIMHQKCRFKKKRHHASCTIDSSSLFLGVADRRRRVCCMNSEWLAVERGEEKMRHVPPSPPRLCASGPPLVPRFASERRTRALACGPTLVV